MRHRRLRRKLGVKSQHRKALLRNLVRSLVTYKRIRTTHARAKEASAFADNMITIAKRGGLHARRVLQSKLACDDTAKTLIKEIAPHFKDRKGGYTRVLRLRERPGDKSEMALLEFTALIEAPASKKPKKEKKKTVKSEPKETVKETKQKEKETKAEESAAESKKKQDLPKEETQKKGGFLGTLRKFLKGGE